MKLEIFLLKEKKRIFMIKITKFVN